MLKVRYVFSKDFDTYIIDNKNSSAIFFTLISAYNYLLKSIALIQNANIVHFDLKGQNIVFDLTRQNPIIIDFGLSLHMKEVSNSSLFDYFYVYAPEYYVWPLEVHYLNFLLHVDDEPSEIRKTVHPKLQRQYQLVIPTAIQRCERRHLRGVKQSPRAPPMRALGFDDRGP